MLRLSHSLTVLLSLTLIVAACAPQAADGGADGDPPAGAATPDPDTNGDERVPLAPLVGDEPYAGTWQLTSLQGVINSESGGNHDMCGDAQYIFAPDVRPLSDEDLFTLEPLSYLLVEEDGNLDFAFYFTESDGHHQRHSSTLGAGPLGTDEYAGHTIDAGGSWNWSDNRISGKVAIVGPLGRSEFSIEGSFASDRLMAGTWKYDSEARGIADCWDRDEGSGTWEAGPA